MSNQLTIFKSTWNFRCESNSSAAAKYLFITALVFAISACSNSPDQTLIKAKAELAQNNLQVAKQTLEELLQEPRKLTSQQKWDAETALLEAKAKSGAKNVQTELVRLNETYPNNFNANLVINTARHLHEASDRTQAIDILSYGEKTFSSDRAAFLKQIEALKQDTNLDDEEIAKLKALGYM